MDTKDYNKIISQLRDKLIGKTIEVPYYFQEDSNGFLDRECHNCGYLFKISSGAWDTLNTTQFCPLCKSQGAKEAFFTEEQGLKRKEQFDLGIREALGNEVTAELEGLYSRKNIQNPYQIEGFPFPNDLVPEKVRELSQIEINCDNCLINYAIYGSAYFCPNCGHHSYEKIFNNSIIKIKAKLNHAELLTSGDQSTNDTNIVIARSLIETSLNDCVIAFQFNIEEVFKSRFPSVSIPFNLFQRIDEGNQFWKQHQATGYVDILTNTELGKLRLYFQKRHLLSHTDGIVNSKYIAKAGDTSYAVGQRIVVKKNEVEDCLSLVEKISGQI